VSVIAELRRRNVFRVAALYGLAAWLTLQVADVLIPALGLPGWVQRLVALFLILGFPLVVIFAWAYELTPDGLKQQHEVDRVPSNSHETGRKLNHAIGALAALAIAVVVVDRLLPEKPSAAATGKAGAAALKLPGPSVAASPPSAVAMTSIAVLPFVNMSSDPEQEYSSDGLAEELLNLLAKLPELRVIGRTSSFQFKGRNEDLRVIGEKLNVAHILEGSVRKGARGDFAARQFLGASKSTGR